MNDFLQSLRSSQAEKQRSAMTRKSYDANFNTPSQRFQYANRYPQTNYKRAYPQQEEVSPNLLQDAIVNLSSHVESFATNQKHLIDAQEKTLSMLERQVVAIERILEHLQIPSK